MLEEAYDDEQIIERVAALDIGKGRVVCCVRVTSTEGGCRRQEVTTLSTMTRSLTVLAERLLELGVDRVVMEATSDYWKAVHIVKRSCRGYRFVAYSASLRIMPISRSLHT